MRLFCTNRYSATISTLEMIQMSTSRSRSTASPKCQAMSGSGFGKFFESAPTVSSTMLNRM